MTLYSVKNWQTLFETNETRKLKTLNWWPKPNKHDGLGFRKMASHSRAVELFCAWDLICDLASKTTPKERRGFLERENLPMTPTDMAYCTGYPEKIFDLALPFFSNPSQGWLCKESPGTPAESPDASGNSPAEGKGREQNGMTEKERREMSIITNARIALHFLNGQSGKNFREVDSSLEPIIQRLSESDVTIEGVRTMISRQVAMWKDSDMAEYLRPSTLFGKEKFNGYYAAKDQPVIRNKINGSNSNGSHAKPDHEAGF